MTAVSPNSNQGQNVIVKPMTIELPKFNMSRVTFLDVCRRFNTIYQIYNGSVDYLSAANAYPNNIHVFFFHASYRFVTWCVFDTALRILKNIFDNNSGDNPSILKHFNNLHDAVVSQDNKRIKKAIREMRSAHETHSTLIDKVLKQSNLPDFEKLMLNIDANRHMFRARLLQETKPEKYVKKLRKALELYNIIFYPEKALKLDEFAKKYGFEIPEKSKKEDPVNDIKFLFEETKTEQKAQEPVQEVKEESDDFDFSKFFDEEEPRIEPSKDSDDNVSDPGSASSDSLSSSWDFSSSLNSIEA